VRTRAHPIRTVNRKWEKQRNKNGPLRQCFPNPFLAYHCHNTKQKRVLLSQYKTCTRTTATIKTCTCTTITIQNKYACYYRNTKHVHVPPYTTQNMYACYYRHKKTCTSTRNCKYYCLLSRYWSSGVFRCGNLRFRTCYSSNSTRIEDKWVLHLYWNIEILDLSWCTLYKCFSIHFNTLNRILIVKLTFLNLVIKIISTYIRLPPSENRCLRVTMYRHSGNHGQQAMFMATACSTYTTLDYTVSQLNQCTTLANAAVKTRKNQWFVFHTCINITIIDYSTIGLQWTFSLFDTARLNRDSGRH
jgi:hypothetical protein